MKVISTRFLTWLMSLTSLMRYFVIAVLFHAVILFVLGSIKIVAILPDIIAQFDAGAIPPATAEDTEIDPFAALRDFEYSGPTLGGGGGTPGRGPGGIPTAAGTTPTEYKASIAAVDASAADSQVAEVIGVMSESATAVARLQGSLGGIAAPTTGFGEGKIGTAGVRGPGGGGFGQRVGPMRAQLISKNKGTQETERAVLAALRWLKQNQKPDGSWAEGQHRAALSALATLCFLGHGETPDSEEFGVTVSKALSFLVTTVGSNGAVPGSMYAQGAVLLALSEAYGMTQAPQIKEPLERCIAAVLQSQKVRKKDPKQAGGWRYSLTAEDSDTSVSGWLIMGLKSAKLAGMDVPEESFSMASAYLWNMYHENGGFGYTSPQQRPSLTGVGVLCQQFLGHGDDRRIKKALDFLKEQKVDWENPPNVHATALYAWYYITQAMFQGGGAYWTYWNSQIRDTLVKNQKPDGSWDAPGKGEKNTHGLVYTTTLCCLMLEVYYRYLPIYQEMERKALPTATTSAK
jgi:hypothetical protein